MKKYLFLDDIRDPADVTWMNIGTGKEYHNSRGAPWNIVRSYDEAVTWVFRNGFPNVISFDHDLGLEKSGHDFAKWLVEYDMETNAMPDNFTFTVHSKNPVGVENIHGLLDNYIRVKRDK